MIDQDTYERMTTTIRRIAAEQFAGHTIEPLGPNEWRCGKPNTGSYAFRVIVRPTMVCVWGDVGHGIFRGGEGDTLAWLRGAVRDPHYLLEKLRPSRADEHFYADDALQHAREGAAEGSAFWGKVVLEAEKMHRRRECLDRTAWEELMLSLGGDCDCFSIGRGYPADAYWLAIALRWFAEHLAKEKESP